MPPLIFLPFSQKLMNSLISQWSEPRGQELEFISLSAFLEDSYQIRHCSRFWNSLQLQPVMLVHTPMAHHSPMLPAASSAGVAALSRNLKSDQSFQTYMLFVMTFFLSTSVWNNSYRRTLLPKPQWQTKLLFQDFSFEDVRHISERRN